ncbi:hypothetical protein HY251_21910 [bacterium]|nr:hypothetical protein [bacterium]
MEKASFGARLLLPCVAAVALASAGSGRSAAAPGGGGSAPVTSKTAGGLGPIFPPTNPWNTDISKLPVHPDSAKFIESVGAGTGLHPDFGKSPESGIPFVVVGPKQAPVPITFTEYGDESDPGPYPISLDAPIEGGEKSEGDRHVLAVDPRSHKLYELYHAFRDGKTGWKAGCGAVFDLASDELRKAGWTSADAAGLPIFPGLVRWDEVQSGAIKHAVRFTVKKTQRGYILPARHFASRSTDASLPPMGLRVRLKAKVDVSKLPPEVQVIATCLKKYGMILADNGSNWFISGAPDPRWNDESLSRIKEIKGSDLEVVDTGPIVTR